MKWRLSLFVMLTVLAGLFSAPSFGSPPDNLSLWGLLLIAMIVTGASSLNCYLEKDLDALMERTKNRPLPAGRLAPKGALILGLCLLLPSFFLLYTLINPLTAFLAFLATFLYLLAYTPLKPKGPLAVLVGAIPGAIPPVLGRTIFLGTLDLLALFLFAFLFVWQIPHFLSISFYHAEDYEKASLPVYGHLWPFKAIVRATIFLTCLLAAVSFLPTLSGDLQGPYPFLIWPLNIFFLGLACLGLLLQKRKTQKKWARAYFRGSIFYLISCLSVFVFCKT